jgi:hypothetical protein
MKPTRIATGLAMIAISLAAVLSLPPEIVHAQCGPATGNPCPPGDKKKKPTPTDTALPRPTKTPAPSSTPTLVFQVQSTGEGGTLIPITTPTATLTPEPPWFQTLVACRNIAELTAIATLGHDDTNPGEHETAIAPCATYAPAATKFVIPPVAGPVFLQPGVKNTLILVLLIGVLLGALIIVVRRFKAPNPNKPK